MMKMMNILTTLVVIGLMASKETSALSCYNCEGILGVCSDLIECPVGFDSCYYTSERDGGYTDHSCGQASYCQAEDTGIAAYDNVKNGLLDQGYTITCCDTDSCNLASGSDVLQFNFITTLLAATFTVVLYSATAWSS